MSKNVLYLTPPEERDFDTYLKRDWEDHGDDYIDMVVEWYVLWSKGYNGTPDILWTTELFKKVFAGFFKDLYGRLDKTGYPVQDKEKYFEKMGELAKVAVGEAWPKIRTRLRLCDE